MTKVNKKDERESLLQMIKDIPVSKDATCSLTERKIYKKTMESAFSRIFSSKDSADAFLKEAGIYNKKGELTKAYK